MREKALKTWREEVGEGDEGSSKTPRQGGFLRDGALEIQFFMPLSTRSKRRGKIHGVRRSSRFENNGYRNEEGESNFLGVLLLGCLWVEKKVAVCIGLSFFMETNVGQNTRVDIFV